MGAAVVLPVVASALLAGGIAAGVITGLSELDCATIDSVECPRHKDPPSAYDPENLPVLGATTVYIWNGHKEWPKVRPEFNERSPIILYDNLHYVKKEDGLDVYKFDNHVPYDTTSNALVYRFDKAPKYFYVTNNVSEPLCLAGVTVVDHLGNFMHISGNYAGQCGAGFFSSYNKNMGDQPPYCMWIDRHQSNGILVRGFRFDLVAEDTSEPPKVVPDPDVYPDKMSDLCKPPFLGSQKILTKREDEGEEDVDNFGTVLNRLPGPPGPSIDFDTRLIKSNLTSSSAVGMCEDENSKGPHLVSHTEKMYCDMTNKRLYPFCEASMMGTCFDDDQDSLVERGGSARVGTRNVKDATVPVKAFENVVVWE